MKSHGMGGTEVRDAKEATCAEEGYTGDVYCLSCGEQIEDGTVIPAADHDYKTEWVTDETSHWHECADCGAPADVETHTFKWVIDQEATETETGSKHEECEACGYQKAAVEIPAVGSNTPDVPQTGDGSKLWIYCLLLLGSGAGVISASVCHRKKKIK